jgi:hypothetical protein
MKDVPGPPDIADRARTVLRMTENAHLQFGRLKALSRVEGLRYPHPSSLRAGGTAAYFLVRLIPRDFVPQQRLGDGHFPSVSRK